MIIPNESFEVNPGNILLPPQLVAIDPGVGGAIAWTLKDEVRVCPMPRDEAKLISLLDLLAGPESIVYLEQVSGFIGRGWQPGHHMFKFGHNYGFLRGLLASRNFEVHLVRPQRWQKELGLVNVAKLPKAAWKRRLWDVAKETFPQLNLKLPQADAALILAYGIQMTQGD